MEDSVLKKCLITGASGLIGSHLLEDLASEWELHAVLRRAPAVPSDGVAWHGLDLTNEWDMDGLPPEIDAVVYLAQSERFREFPEGADEVFRVNTLSMLRMLEYARRARARTFVLASSGGVYGSGERALSEDLEISAKGDLGFYLSTKVCSEILAANYTPFMNVVALRFFFVYGPGQRRSMLVPRLIENVRHGRPITLQGSDGIRLNPTYVSDAVSAVRAALDLEESCTVNVAGPEVLTLRQIGEKIGGALGCVPRFEIDHGSRPAEVIGTTALMTELLGGPRVTFSQGIRRMLSPQSVL